MPGFPVSAVQRIKRAITVTLVDTTGEKGSTSISGYSGDVTDPQEAAFRNAIADASNAGLIASTASQKTQIVVTDAEAYDEAQSSVTTKGVFVFQNQDFQQVSVSVPAPDDSMLAADGQTIDPANAQAIAVIDAALDILNTPVGVGPAGTYAFVRG